MTLPFLPLVKADQATHTIWARAAVEEADKSREIMDYASAVPQFKAWSNGFKEATLGKSLGNIRGMHNPRHLAGKVVDIVFDDDAKAVDICLKVLDPVDWTKVEEGGYTGLSIGGGYVKRWKDGDLTRYTPRIAEISLVDSPCMPSALILNKRDGSVTEVMLKGEPRSFAALVPPPTFNDLMEKGILGRLNEFTDKIAAHPVVTSIADHPGTKLAGKVMRGSKAVREGIGVVGGVTGLASGVYEVKHHKKDKLPPGPSYMQKGLLSVAARVAKPAFETATTIAEHPITRTVGMGLDAADAIKHLGGGRGEAAAPAALKPKLPRKPSLAMPNYMSKAASTAEREKIATTMHEWKAGKLRSYRGVNPRTGKPRRGPTVADQRQAIAIALSQAKRLGKQEDALLEVIEKRAQEHPIDRSAAAGATGKPGSEGHALSEKERDQRIAAAKARWLEEGHDNHDAHFDKLHAAATKSMLGRDKKVAGVAQQRGNFWHGVADTQDAYDKVRKHLPKDAHLMMEVQHAGGLLYNPENVGEGHFGDDGQAKKPLYMLHPSEADDWIAKHGKHADAVTKRTPSGLVTHRDQLAPAQPTTVAA